MLVGYGARVGDEQMGRTKRTTISNDHRGNFEHSTRPKAVGIDEPHGDLCVAQSLATLARIFSDVVRPAVCIVMRKGPGFAMGHLHVLRPSRRVFV